MTFIEAVTAIRDTPAYSYCIRRPSHLYGIVRPSDNTLQRLTRYSHTADVILGVDDILAEDWIVERPA